MSKHSKRLPYGDLGKLLHRLRVGRKESLAEVSGAVEIDIDVLSKIEQGIDRPNEDILMLLMSHFNLKDQEADKIWQLAGYDKESSHAQEPRPVVALSAEDLKIVYTDMAHVSVNDYGVVMNFMQGGGPGSQPLAVARVGMSREHAQSILELLQRTLHPQTRQLQAPEEQN